MTPRSIAITGGIGAGKSAALQAFRDLGAAVQSSDELVHAVYADPEVVAAVVERFGPGVVAADGSLDRSALGTIVFADPAGLRFLEQLVHPRIGHARTAWVAAQRALDPPPPLLVSEVPLLFEADLADQFDAVLVVTAGDDVRRARVCERGQDFDARRATQLPESRKVELADASFVNEGTLDALHAWVAERFDTYRV